MLKCPHCHEDTMLYVVGVVKHASRAPKGAVKKKDGNIRHCTNPKCEKYRVIQNRCRIRKHGFYDTTDGKDLGCPVCNQEKEEEPLRSKEPRSEDSKLSA